MRLLWSIAAPAALVLCLSACAGTQVGNPTGSQQSGTQSASLVLDWYPNSDHGGLYAAIQKGFFRRDHIDITPYTPSDTSAQIKLVASGRADFGITYETDLLAARAQHIPVRSVMCIMQHPLDTVMALKGSGITRPRALIDKTVGEAGAPSDNPILAAMLEHDGASFGQVRTVNVGYNLLPALLSKRVDAVIGVYWTWEAIQAQLKGFPVNVMRVERWGVPNYCELVLVANDRTIRTRPAYIGNVVHAMQQGYAYAAAHPAAAWQALHARDKTLEPGLVLRSLRLLRPVVTDASTVGYQSPTQWQHYADWLFANKLVPDRINASSAFTNRFLLRQVR